MNDESKTECPCGCGQEVPQKCHNHFAKSDPYWEWVCASIYCEKRQMRMQNQSGDDACSWCGSTRSLVGHFAGTRLDVGRKRRTVTGELLSYPRSSSDHLIRETPKHLIRPYQDVT